MFKQLITYIILIGMITGRAYAISAKEYEIKAAFLYNLGSFITWPETTFDYTSNYFNICILGQDPFNQRLQSLTQDQQISGRSISVKQMVSINEATNCHILFVSSSEQDKLTSIFNWLNGKPILTVSDIDNFILSGGMLQFFKRQNKVRLALDPEAISEVKLKASAHLMKIAELIRSSK